MNPKYNKANFHDDIAILFLASDVEFTNYVRPICLWEATDGIEDVVGKEGIVRPLTPQPKSCQYNRNLLYFYFICKGRWLGLQ